MFQTPDAFSPRERARIEATTLEVGRFIFDRCQSDRPRVFDRRWWDDRMMAWAMGDEALKIQMFRFVDVLPMLRTSVAVTQHMQEYFHDVRGPLPGAVRLGIGRGFAAVVGRPGPGHCRAPECAKLRPPLRGRQQYDRSAGRRHARTETAPGLHARHPGRSRGQRSRSRSLPATLYRPDPRHRLDRQCLARGSAGRPRAASPRCRGSTSRSSFRRSTANSTPSIRPERPGAWRPDCVHCCVARAEKAFVHVDMESYAAKDLTLAIFQQVLAEPEFRDWPDVGIVIQAYLRDAAADLAALRDWARNRGTPVWVRLVKGAYWDYETVHAQAQGWPVPVFQQKWESDANFERLTEFLLRNYAFLRPALGSHNIRSLAHGIAVARHLGIPASGLELQMLYGMADQEKQVLVDMGYRLRVYMPYGQLLPGMSYLVRRLLENTSNESFLKASFSDHVSPEKLLMNPMEQAGNRPRSTGPDERGFARGRRNAGQIPQRALGGFCRRGQSPGHAASARPGGRSNLAAISAVDRWPRGRYPKRIDFLEPVASQPGGRHGRGCQGGRCRGARLRRPKRRCRPGRAWASKPAPVSRARGRPHVPAAVRTGRLAGLRMRQALARSRCRRDRGHRLLPLLRPGSPHLHGRRAATCRAKRTSYSTCRGAWRP